MSIQYSPSVRVLMTAGTVIGGIFGYGSGVLASMALGLQFHGSYEFYTLGTAIGNLLIIGGTCIGLAIPWIIRPLTRYSRSQ